MFKTELPKFVLYQHRILEGLTQIKGYDLYGFVQNKYKLHMSFYHPELEHFIEIDFDATAPDLITVDDQSGPYPEKMSPSQFIESYIFN